MYKILFLMIISISLLTTSCEFIEDENEGYVFKIEFKPKNVVFDFLKDGKCPHPVAIKTQDNKLLLFLYSDTYDRNQIRFRGPDIFFSANYSFIQDYFLPNPQYVLTKDCRLIAAVDVDSLDSNGEASLDFKIINMISGDEAVVQGKYLPSDFQDSSECNSDGAYRVSEYPQIPVCFNSLPINETVEFEPPVSTDYLEEHIRDFYDKEYLNWQCIGD